MDGVAPEAIRNNQFAPLSELQDQEIKLRLTASINLMDNTTRGLLGEVLVAIALGGSLTAPWDSWDVSLPSGTRVEVKTTGSVQAWRQQRPSIPVWSIAAAGSWMDDGKSYVWDQVPQRRSHLYVFALHDGVNPGLVDEWTFRLIATEHLDANFASQKSISLASLERAFHPPAFTFTQLRSETTGILSRLNMS